MDKEKNIETGTFDLYPRSEKNMRSDSIDKELQDSEKLYQMLFDHSMDGIILTDPRDGGKILSANPAACRMLGWTEEELVGKGRDEIFDLQDPALSALLDERARSGSARAQLTYRRKDRTTFSGEVSTAFFTDNNGEPRAVAIIRDITERKEAEEKLKETLDNLDKLVKERTVELEKAYKSLKESEEGLAESQRMAHIGNWDWNLVTGKVCWSEELYRIFGRSPQESGATYDEFLSYVHPDDRDRVNNAIKKGLYGKPIAGDYRIILANGEKRIVHTEAEVVFYEENNPVRMRGTVQDITERKKVEEELHKNQELLRGIIDNTPALIYVLDLEERITVANKALAYLLSKTSEELIGRTRHGLMPEETAIRDEENDRHVIASGSSMEFEEHGIFDGMPKTYFTVKFPIRDAKGEIHSIAGISTDITDRKKAEEALAKIEIARKQEIHHRIKNNLQVISSLLDLQAEQFRDKECIKDSEVLEAFRESQDRVISMALIHEELYKGGGFETLNFAPYIEELAENLFRTYRLGNTDINLKLDLAENAFFDMDIAVPLGMIVNELVSNSLKHAFIGRDEGEIRIKLSREEYSELESEDCESSNFVLTVSDNGVGIPENLDIEDIDSLGMQLVTTLVDQLDGEFELKRNNGTEFTMRFTVKENNNPASVPAPQLME